MAVNNFQVIICGIGVDNSLQLNKSYIAYLIKAIDSVRVVKHIHFICQLPSSHYILTSAVTLQI